VARRDTRELILATSLALFNEQGEPNVSTNLIALEADISPGNLYYHFRHKEDLALELFKRYLLEMDPLLEENPAASPSLDDLHLRLHLLFEIMERYRFLFRNLADLTARIPNLREAMLGLMARQAGTLGSVVERLRNAGMMEIGSTASAQLVHNLMLQMTYWIPFAEVRGEVGLHDGRSSAHAVARALYLVLPYLTGSNRARFEAAAAEYLDA
jgi:AcrR family transcriptional regulator